MKTLGSEFYKALTDEERTTMISKIAELEAEKLKLLGVDYENDPNSMDTPNRVAKMVVNELCSGRFTDPPKITDFENTNNYNQLITVGPVTVKSTCAHHLMPFEGEAYIGILPKDNGKIIGVSKFARIVDYYSRRYQIQENLTQQVLNAIVDAADPLFACVTIRSKHLCMSHRGVNEHASQMVTTFPYIANDDEGNPGDMGRILDEFLGEVRTNRLMSKT